MLISVEDYFHELSSFMEVQSPFNFRATSQWFISMKKKILEKALEEIEKVRWIPENSKNRITSMVLDRPDWCVSRQKLGCSNYSFCF